MKIGLVGYQGSGKSTLFEWLTGVPADPALAHRTQSAMAAVPDARVEPLSAVYQPKKVTLAALEIVDTPGLSRSHEGNAARLGMIREAGCLVMVVGAFAAADPLADWRSFQEDLLLADLEIVSGRIDRLRESLHKPRPNREEHEAELAALLPILEQLEAGKAVRDDELADDQRRATKSFQLLSAKRRMILLNVADDETDFARFGAAAPDGTPIGAVAVGLERELARMEPGERQAFRQEMGVPARDRGDLLRRIMEVSGQMLFFTAGEREVRTWMIRRGATALEAADGVHTDMARGFIRAETIKCDDLIRLGSEREIKAHNLLRHEPKDYVVQDGDILLFRFSV
jgi:ribosome-binding ATPase YchF (GTP1/OBG family)